MTWPLGSLPFPQASSRHCEDRLHSSLHCQAGTSTHWPDRRLLECIHQLSEEDLQDTEQCSVEAIKGLGLCHVEFGVSTGRQVAGTIGVRCKMLPMRPVMIGFKT